MTEKLEALLKKKEQLEAQIASEKAKKAKEKRKLENKLKILVGAYYLDKARKEGTIKELHNEMDSYLTRQTDRKALSILRTEIANLEPQQTEKSESETTDSDNQKKSEAVS